MVMDIKTTRKIILVLAAIGYAIAPADLLPDIIPFIGTLDDATVALIAGYFSKD